MGKGIRIEVRQRTLEQARDTGLAYEHSEVGYNYRLSNVHVQRELTNTKNEGIDSE